MPLLKGQFVMKKTTYTYEGLLNLLAGVPNLFSEEVSTETVDKISTYGRALWQQCGKGDDMDYWIKQGITVTEVKLLYFKYHGSLPSVSGFLCVDHKDLLHWLKKFPNDPFVKQYILKTRKQAPAIDRVELECLINAGLSNTEIAKRLDRSVNTVTMASNRWGLVRNKKYNPITAAELLNYVDTYESLDDILKASSRSRAYLQSAAKKFNLVKQCSILWPQGVRKGEPGYKIA